ncbi:MAG: GGDEF domain-containing protein [Deltaproteobacteria bacterium]|nr:GGDEF domain-containing protein [Deltaproteobacteria bacterium]
MHQNAPATEPFTQEELEAIRSHATLLFCPEGEVIFRVGEPGNSMFLILEGAVRLILDGHRGSRTLSENRFFGEDSFIMEGSTRKDTAVAETPVRLAVLDQRIVDSLLAENPRVMFSVLKKVCGHLLGFHHALVRDLKNQNAELVRAMEYLRRTKEELNARELAERTDDLTGLYNRRCLDKHLRRILQKHAAEPMGLILLNLDGFRSVNDACGHQAGDELLYRVAEALMNKVRRTDMPFRLSGDEFALLLPGMTNSRGPVLCEEVRQAVAALPPACPEHKNGVTATVAGSMLHPAETPAQFLERVDNLLYRAKKEGGNRTVWSAGPGN